MSHRDDPDTVGKIRLQIFSSSGQLGLLGLSLSVIDFTNLFYFGPVACFTALPSARSSRCATNRSPVKNLRADARLDCGTLTRKSSLKALPTLRRYFWRGAA